MDIHIQNIWYVFLSRRLVIYTCNFFSLMCKCMYVFGGSLSTTALAVKGEKENHEHDNGDLWNTTYKKQRGIRLRLTVNRVLMLCFRSLRRSFVRKLQSVCGFKVLYELLQVLKFFSITRSTVQSVKGSKMGCKPNSTTTTNFRNKNERYNNGRRLNRSK